MKKGGVAAATLTQNVRPDDGGKINGLVVTRAVALVRKGASAGAKAALLCTAQSFWFGLSPGRHVFKVFAVGPGLVIDRVSLP